MYMYLFLLTNPMCPGLGLEVILGVPIRVENHDCVCRGEVDPQTPCTGRKKETKVVRPLGIEVVDSVLTRVTTNRAIQSLWG